MSLIGMFLLTLFLSEKVYKYFEKKKRLKRLSKSNITTVDKMDGDQFEIYLQALLQRLGYKAVVTQKSRDFGADLIIKGKKRIVVQAKRYKTHNKVGISAVQEIYAAQRYYKANESWIITNSLYTKSAIELAKACDVKLIDRFELVKLMEQNL